MCGIAGVVGGRDLARTGGAVAAMTHDLERRGPDTEGAECWSTAVLGHRRLSIFDLSDAGRQPMVTGDRSLAVVFNGAIYNFRDLRADLERSGYAFRSQTDTEVLLHGFREWGIHGLVRRLRGMFAIGLWDATEERLYLVRDRLGVKPLVFCVTGPELAFASTVRALHRAGFGGDISPAAVLEFLEFGYVTDARAIYEGIRKVPAGGLIVFDVRTGRLTEERYWTSPEPPRDGRGEASRFDDVVAEVERRLLDAVRLRLSADVEVAALLSGGIDSALVCWGIRECGGDLTAYTVGVPGDPADESSAASVTARRLGIRHEILPIEPDSAPDVGDLVEAFGEPFACASALGLLGVSQLVRANATVLLTGDGGDDVFLGYPEHRHFLLAERAARLVPRPVLRGWRTARRAWPTAGPLKRARNFADYVAGGLAGVTAVHDGLPNYGAVLSGPLQGAVIPQRQLPWPADGGRTLLSDFLRYDFGQRFTGEYLPKVDGATMHYALEARCPFLDHELWEYAAQLPFEIRLHRYELKAVLRHIARQRIGSDIASAGKRGFTIPVEQWMTTRWRERVAAAFDRPVLGDLGWIDAEAARRQLQDAVERGRAPKQLWYLFVLEHWLRSA